METKAVRSFPSPQWYPLLDRVGVAAICAASMGLRHARVLDPPDRAGNPAVSGTRPTRRSTRSPDQKGEGGHRSCSKPGAIAQWIVAEGAASADIGGQQVFERLRPARAVAGDLEGAGRNRPDRDRAGFHHVIAEAFPLSPGDRRHLFGRSHHDRRTTRAKARIQPPGSRRTSVAASPQQWRVHPCSMI